MSWLRSPERGHPSSGDGSYVEFEPLFSARCLLNTVCVFECSMR
jgi:hypothetical protein